MDAKVRMKIKKTVIGSFPSISHNYEESMRRIVDIQLKYGMDIVSDGEQRADMITYFRDIPGLEPSPRGLRVCSKIMPPEDPGETIKVKDFITVRDYLKEIGRVDVAVKTAITGPVTLGLACAASGLKHYSGLNDMNLYLDLSKALGSIATHLLEIGSYVQIDEPGISAGFISPSKASLILEELFTIIGEVRRRSDSLSIHVCGDLTGKMDFIEKLLQLDLDIISLAFSGAREGGNMSLLNKDLFNRSGKKLGAGIISVSSTRESDVDSEDNIYLRLRKISGMVGCENIAYAHPDCGMKNTPLNVSEIILQRLSMAVDRYNEYLKSRRA